MHSALSTEALLAIVGVQAVTDVAVLRLGRREAGLERWLPYLVSGAAGVLLATACLDLLPEAAQAATPHGAVWVVLLLTLLSLFCVQVGVNSLTDRALQTSEPDVAVTPEVHTHKRAEHSDQSHRGGAPNAQPAVLMLGSALHSLVDGIAIAAAFLAGPRPGLSAALAVLLHELPHRTGDFALLLHMGVRRQLAAQLAIGAGAMALIGGSAVLLLGEHGPSPTYLLPVSAGSFLYIALVDLIPELHAHRRGRKISGQTVCFLAGAALVALLIHLPGA